MKNDNNEGWCNDRPEEQSVFESMLNSSALLATLYTKDLLALGINMRDYGAQGYIELARANKNLNPKVYELHVSSHGDEGSKSILNPNNPENWCGGIFPVAGIIGQPKRNPEGGLAHDRLLDIILFLWSYFQIAPGHKCAILCETRNDMVGHFKIPPFKRREMVRTLYEDSRLLNFICCVGAGPETSIEDALERNS